MPQAHRHPERPGDRLRADRDRAGLRVRLLRAPRPAGCCEAEGLRVILVNSNPATIMTDPEFADATYVEPITPEFVEKVIEKERPDALLATLGGQTALNARDRAATSAGVLEKYGVELIGASIEAIEAGENRESFKRIVEELGGETARSVICHTMDDCLGGRRGARLPDGGPAVLHDGRRRLRDGVRRRRPAPDRRRRARGQPDHRGAPRGVDPRLEGVRAGGDARPGRQRRDRLLDREPRPDGRAHRRLDHRRAGDDADRPRVPADARPRRSGSSARSAWTPAAATSSSRSTRPTAG